MSAAANDPPRAGPTHIEPASPELLSDPLDFFFAEHFRQRTLYHCVEQLATAESLDRDLASEVLAFLRHDMMLHVQDEEESLFPAMRRRCPPEDEIERVLSALSAEHAGDRHFGEVAIAGLEAALAGGTLPSRKPALREAMVDFARNERRHLALENSIVLPLARLRLTAEDLAEISLQMMQRRGQPFAEEAAK